MMYEDYIKEVKIKDRKEKEREIELMSSIIKTKQDLINVNRNYEFAEDELIDYYAYQMKAIQSKLDYLIKQVKEKGLIMDMVKEIEIRSLQDEAM